MPKRTVRIDIPAAYINDLAHLVERVWGHHVSLGSSSPFFDNSIVNMNRYEELMNEALSKRKRALELHAEAEALMQESRVIFGIDAGQTISTVDTLYHLLNNIKHLLKAKHAMVEHELSSWGFNVVIGSSSVGAKKKKKTA